MKLHWPFINLNGQAIRFDKIVAVRCADEHRPDYPTNPTIIPTRVIVDFVTNGGSHNCVILNCKTNGERDLLAEKLISETSSSFRRLQTQPELISMFIGEKHDI